MPRVLVVTGSWEPTMIADMQRARHLSWTLPSKGWSLEVLSPGAGFQPPSCLDEDSSEFFSPEVHAHSADRMRFDLMGWLGSTGIGWRSLSPMWWAGRRLLASGRFDLIYFTTAQLPLLLLGPAWSREFSIPYVLDIHDPISSDSKLPRGMKRPRARQWFSRLVTNFIERHAVLRSSGLIAVSSRYLADLRAKYESARPSWEWEERTRAVPFGVLEEDFRHFDEVQLQRQEEAVVIYVGAGGPVMHRSFALLCRTIRSLQEEDPELIEKVKLQFFGTMLGWKEGDGNYFEQVSVENGVGARVEERPGRVTYRRSIELLLSCRGALLLGVDDAGYMPSKLYSYAYAGRPLLGVVRADGPASGAILQLGELAEVLWFAGDSEVAAAEAVARLRRFFEAVHRGDRVDRRSRLEAFGADAMAEQHARLFERCLGSP